MSPGFYFAQNLFVQLSYEFIELPAPCGHVFRSEDCGTRNEYVRSAFYQHLCIGKSHSSVYLDEEIELFFIPYLIQFADFKGRVRDELLSSEARVYAHDEHQVDFSKARNMLICAVTIVCALGIGFSKAGHLSFGCGTVTITLSGLAVGALMGILLNALLPGKDYVFDEARDASKDLKKPNPDNGIHN